MEMAWALPHGSLASSHALQAGAPQLNKQDTLHPLVGEEIFAILRRVRHLYVVALEQNKDDLATFRTTLVEAKGVVPVTDMTDGAFREKIANRPLPAELASLQGGDAEVARLAAASWAGGLQANHPPGKSSYLWVPGPQGT